MTISSRIQAAEKEDLGALSAGRGTLWRNLLLLSLPIALFIALALYALTRSIWVSASLSLAFYSASVYSNIGFFRKAGRIKAAPEAAVERIEVLAHHVLELEPQGSNGPVFAFLTESGECLLLVGQWLLEQKRFPSRHLRVYRWRADGEPIRTESLGPKQRPLQSQAGLNNTHRVGPVQIFRARLESFAHDLDVALS